MENGTFSFWCSASATVTLISTNHHPAMFHSATVRPKRLEPGIVQYSAGQKFRTFIAMNFLWPPWERGANFEHGGVWNKLSTTSKVYLSPPGRLEKNFYLNVRNFWLRLYMRNSTTGGRNGRNSLSALSKGIGSLDCRRKGSESCLLFEQLTRGVTVGQHSFDFEHDSNMKIYTNPSEMLINSGFGNLFWECPKGGGFCATAQENLFITI